MKCSSVQISEIWTNEAEPYSAHERDARPSVRSSFTLTCFKCSSRLCLQSPSFGGPNGCPVCFTCGESAKHIGDLPAQYCSHFQVVTFTKSGSHLHQKGRVCLHPPPPSGTVLNPHPTPLTLGHGYWHLPVGKNLNIFLFVTDTVHHYSVFCLYSIFQLHETDLVRASSKVT